MMEATLKIADELEKKEKILEYALSFPTHVGDYDPELPERIAGNESDGPAAFRAGWTACVLVMRDMIMKIAWGEK